MNIMKLASHLQLFLAISARKKHASFFISKFHSPRDRAVAPKNGVATTRSKSAVGLWHFQVLVNDTDTLYTLLHINCTYRNHTTNVYAYTHMYTYIYIYVSWAHHTHTYIYIQICNPLTLLIPKFLVNFQTEIFSLGLGLGSDLAGRWCGNAWNRPGREWWPAKRAVDAIGKSYLPSGKHTKNYGKPAFLMEKLTIDCHFQ